MKTIKLTFRRVMSDTGKDTATIKVRDNVRIEVLAAAQGREAEFTVVLIEESQKQGARLS